jgi:zinc protease
MNLRETNGFTYHVRSGFGFRRHPGPFVTSTAVRNDVTAAAIREILAELRRIGSGDVTPQELDEAKSYLAGSFPMTVQTAGNLAARIEEIEIYGLPDAYFDTFRENLSGVASTDVERVAKQYVHPDLATIVVVGKADGVRGSLDGLGMPVRTVD